MGTGLAAECQGTDLGVLPLLSEDVHFCRLLSALNVSFFKTDCGARTVMVFRWTLAKGLSIISFCLLNSTFRVLGLSDDAHLSGREGGSSSKHHLSFAPTFFRRKNETTGEYVNRNSDEFKVPFLEAEGVLTVTEAGGTGASLTALPSLLLSGDDIVVAFSNIPNPTLDDWVGLFCPQSANDTNYLDWVSVTHLTRKKTQAPTSGEGIMTLRDTRDTCEYRYFSKLSGGGYSKVATSNSVAFETNQPVHGHIALTGDITEMRVHFISSTDSAKPFVYYGTSALQPNTNRVYGRTHTYTNTDMCGSPANTTVGEGGGYIPPGFMHEVLLTHLTPGKRYFYSYGQDETKMSKMLSFVAAPKVNPDYNFSFIIYADMGTWADDRADTTSDLSLQLVDEGSELVVHCGDISYARGHAYLWDQWHQIIEPYATRVPYMVGIGNHEYDHLELNSGHDPSGAPGVGFHPFWGNYGDDSHGECGVPVYNRFTMPDNGNALYWYSFDYGSVHFAIVSTEHNISAGSLQYKWLEKDLASVDRAKTPWLLVQGHRPMYNSENYDSDYNVSVHQREMYEDLLHKYAVDLAWYGHYHAYERTCPVYRGKCTAYGQGTIHFTIGSAGYNVDQSTLLNKTWSMFEDNDYGIGKVTVANKTAMHVEYIRNTDGVVADDVWVYKDGAGTVITRAGCTCKEPWQGLDAETTLYGCQNPDGDTKGSWCKVNEAGCGMPPVNSTKGLGSWDYCVSSPPKTKAGCTCKSPYWSGQRKYYGCAFAGKTTYQWCYTGDECGTKGQRGYWDKC